MSTEDRFKWGDESNVFETVRGVAVYRNPKGDIVIRQEGWPDDDAVIVIPIEQANSVLAAIREAKRGNR